jgi:hypothetical protein
MDDTIINAGMEEPVETPLRYRQIHLDYHNGAQIPGIGAHFDRRQFQEMLESAVSTG